MMTAARVWEYACHITTCITIDKYIVLYCCTPFFKLDKTSYRPGYCLPMCASPSLIIPMLMSKPSFS